MVASEKVSLEAVWGVDLAGMNLVARKLIDFHNPAWRNE